MDDPVCLVALFLAYLIKYNAGMLALWKRTHFDTRFYRQVGQISVWRTVLYLLTVYAILAVARTALFASRTLPQWRQDVTATWEAIRDQWPADATVQLSPGGDLTLTGTDRLEITFPEPVAKRYAFPKYFFVIDPDNMAESVSTPQDLPALVVAGSQTVWLKRTAGDFEPFSLAEIWPEETRIDSPAGSPASNPVTITQPFLQASTTTVQAAIGQAAITLIPLSFGWFWLMQLGVRLLFLVLMTWLAQPLLWVFGWFMNYARAFRLGLFILPIAEEMTLLLTFLYPDNQVFSFWLIWLLALLVIAWTNRQPVVIKRG